MEIAVVVLLVCQVVMPVMLVAAGVLWFRHEVRTLRQGLISEINHLINREPCQSASVLNSIAQMVGSEAGRSAKASLMADLAHVKRAENQAGDDMQIQLIQDQNPGIAGVLAGMGSGQRSRLFKNPLVQLAINAFMGSLGSGSGRSPGPSSDHESLRDRIAKGG